MIDLTLPLEEGMLSFPGYPAFEKEALETFASDQKRSHRFIATSHTGTHIDAPAHFIEDGATIDELNLSRLNGRTTVVDLRDYSGSQITASILEEHIEPEDLNPRLLLMTGDVDSLPHSEAFFDNAAVLTESAAKWIVDADVQVLANDFLTESIHAENRPVHRTLLQADIPIVEYLQNTEEIAELATIQLRCLPLRLSGFEAAPARVIGKRIKK